MSDESGCVSTHSKTVEQIHREAYCLTRLCRELRGQVTSAKMNLTYLRETIEFLNYVSSALRSIEGFLAKAVRADLPPEVTRARLRDCIELKKSIGWLYTITKNTIDSDSLSIPFPLATYLNHLARRLVPDASLVVLTVPNLNFYQLNLCDLRLHAKSVAQRVPGYPELPQSLGILMFPYCAAKDLLVNCILLHEMGHYIYDTTELSSQIQEMFSRQWKLYVSDEQRAKRFSTIREPLLFWASLHNHARDRILIWSNEIFADLFAIRLLGAAYHLAYLEMEQVLPSTGKRGRVFSHTHPADDFRFKLHANWLEKGGWIQELRERTPSVFDALAACKDLDVDTHTFTIDTPVPIPPDKTDLRADLYDWMLGTLWNLIPLIEKAVSEKSMGIPEPIDDFRAHDTAVADLLAHGVVPSTVFHKSGKRSYPAPTTILNSGFFFYLTRIDILLDKVEAEDTRFERRLKYESRLNEWLSKAIEDWHILTKR